VQHDDPAPTYTIREIRPDDQTALTAFYATLSPDSLEARFLGASPGIGDGLARRFCGPDHEHRQGLVAEAIDADGRTTIIGHLCLEPSGSGDLEMAIAVADAWQRHGVGHALLADAIQWADERGVRRLHAVMRWSNAAVAGLVRSMGRPVETGGSDAGVVDVVVRLSADAPRAA
jgi:acetyltransferase